MQKVTKCIIIIYEISACSCDNKLFIIPDLKYLNGFPISESIKLTPS